MACVILLKFTFVYNGNSDMNLYPLFFFLVFTFGFPCKQMSVLHSCRCFVKVG